MFDPSAEDLAPSPIYQRPAKTGAGGDHYMDLLDSESRRRLDAARNAEAKQNPLDSERVQNLHGTLMGHYTRELDRQAENRIEMANDEAIFDHDHWTAEELAELAERGQPPLVFNVTQTTVNWVLGSQRRAAMDYKILARREEGVKAAQRKSELLRHLRDTNLSDYEEADAFADAVKAGLGWLETAQGSTDDGTIVVNRRESWRNMLWDSTAQRYDLWDARYISRTKWLDLDVAMTLWPTRRGTLLQASNNVTLGLYTLDDIGDDVMDSQEAAHFEVDGGQARAGAYSAHRARVRAIEMWFKLPVPDAMIIKGGQFHGQLFDEWSPGHWREIQTQRATLVLRPKEVIHVALMTDAGMLDLRPTPYRHNRYPFTPIWGYRRASDGMPYGLIRGVRGPQRDLNKRASKALHHLSTTRVLLEEGSVDDIDQVRTEAGRPDAVIVYKRGFNPPQVAADTNLAAAHMELMGRDAQMIQSIGGVTDENLGRRTNATSGIAIERRQDQGALATSTFFENLRRSRILHGQKLLVNVEQFYTERDEFRLLDDRGNEDFKVINDGNPDNAIADTAADFIIGEEEWRASARQAQVEQLFGLFKELAATAPQLVLKCLDILIEATDVPKKDEIVKRVRQENGTIDPKADLNNPDPETAAILDAQAKQAEMADRANKAQLDEIEAAARAAMANAVRAEKAVTADAIAQLEAALQAAVSIASAPGLAQSADAILAEAKAEAGIEPMGAAPVAPQPAMPEAMMPVDPNQLPPTTNQGVMP